MNRGRNGKKDVRLFLRPGKPEKANNLIINSLWIVFYVEWYQLAPITNNEKAWIDANILTKENNQDWDKNCCKCGNEYNRRSEGLCD